MKNQSKGKIKVRDEKEKYVRRKDRTCHNNDD